jgi:Clostripain family
MIAPLLEWTVMIYFAAPDNNLVAAAFNNIDEIMQVGSTDRVHILAQLDNLPDAKTHRFFMRVGGGALDQTDIAESNTGSVDDFVSFIKWAIDGGHQAKRYLIVFWGHGNGIEDFPADESSSPKAIPVSVTAMASPRLPKTSGAPAGVASGLETLALSSESIGSLISFATNAPSTKLVGALLPDDNPRDALTSRELKEALDRAKEELGVGKIDIVGMDACLMSMVEVARQISDSAALMVASEQTIPDASWPYGNIVRKLVDYPAFAPPDLAQLIVKEYVAFYEASPTHEQVALSACDLGQTDSLAEAIRRLVVVIRKCLSVDELRLALVKARFSTLSFFISDFIDLHHFCSVLQDTLDDDLFKTTCRQAAALCAEVKSACKGVMQVIRPEAGSGFVMKSAVSFPDTSDIRNAHGVSIYFPLILPLYGELELNKCTNWGEFLKDYMKTFFLQAGASGSAASLTSRSALPMDGNGSNSKGGITAMAQARTACLVIPKGTSINDTATGFKKKLTALAFLDMVPNPQVQLPGGTKLDIPGEGVKASSGTEMKTTPPGTRLGTPAAPVVEMVVPACTLRETTAGSNSTELSDGTSIKTVGASSPIIAIKKITVAPKPA